MKWIEELLMVKLAISAESWINQLAVPDVQLEGEGVMFRYLLFDLERAGVSKTILRGVNYQSYNADLEQEIIRTTREELQGHAFFEGGGQLNVKGGASVAYNPYYQTIKLFGTSSNYGAEEDRKASAKLLECAYPECEVSWFNVEPNARNSGTSESGMPPNNMEE